MTTLKKKNQSKDKIASDIPKLMEVYFQNLKPKSSTKKKSFHKLESTNSLGSKEDSKNIYFQLSKLFYRM